jgi:hypothetical protein
MSSSLRKRIERLESTGQDVAAMVEALGHAYECMRCDYGQTPRPPAPKVVRDLARLPSPGQRLARAQKIWPGYKPVSDAIKPMIAFELEHLIETGELVHRAFCYDPSVELIPPEGEA